MKKIIEIFFGILYGAGILFLSFLEFILFLSFFVKENDLEFFIKSFGLILYFIFYVINFIIYVYLGKKSNDLKINTYE